MKSEYTEEVIQNFNLTFSKSEAEAMALTLAEWHAYGEVGYPPAVFQSLLRELDRMLSEASD